MKNALLFVVLAISVNGFAQNKEPITGGQLPSSRSILNAQLKIEDERHMTPGIYSEKNSGQIDNDPSQEKKWSFSLFGGFSLLGSGADIRRKMKESGFGDKRPAHDSWLGHIPSKNYPKNRIGTIWNLETRYNVSKKSALNFTAGKINQSWVKGYDDVLRSYGNYLQINSDLWSASFNYVWRTGRHNDGFSIGPVIAWHKISAGAPSLFPDNSSIPSAIKAGCNLGYTYSFVQKKSWFLSFKANYTWLPGIEIGPFTRGDREHESVFKETQMRLSTLNFGITTGWRW